MACLHRVLDGKALFKFIRASGGHGLVDWRKRSIAPSKRQARRVTFLLMQLSNMTRDEVIRSAELAESGIPSSTPKLSTVATGMVTVFTGSIGMVQKIPMLVLVSQGLR